MISLQYLAGIIDSEGCIRINKEKRYNKSGGVNYQYKAFLSIGMCCEEVIQEINKVFPRKIKKRIRKSGYKDFYVISYLLSSAVEILKAVYPFLKVKKDQADIIFKLQNDKNNRIKINHEKYFLQISKIKEKNCNSYNIPVKIIPAAESIVPTGEDIKYIAGLIDGDGCIGDYTRIRKDRENKKQKVYAVFLLMNRLEGISFLQQFYGGNILTEKGAGKKAFFLQYRKIETVRKILKDIEPYLVEKRNKCQEILEKIQVKSPMKFLE